MGRKEGGFCATFADGWEPVKYKVASTEVYFRTKLRLNPSGRLAAIGMGQKLVEALSLFWGGELCPHLAQCGLDQGPPPCQMPL